MRGAGTLLLFAACGGANAQSAARQAPTESPGSTLSPDGGGAEGGIPTVGATEPFAGQVVTVWGDPGKAPPLPPPCTGPTCCSTSVGGSLPHETIERIIHLNRAGLRACYAAGLRRNPSLAGRVMVHFTIDRAGTVASVTTDASSTLDDANVQSCLTDAFKRLSFPQPEGGTVGVDYPMVFTPQR